MLVFILLGSESSDNSITFNYAMHMTFVKTNELCHWPAHIM